MTLKKLIARRIALAGPSVLGSLTFVFIVLLLLSPVMRVALFIESPRDLNPENLERLIHQAGLDQPIPVQYANWLRRVLILDFGYSLSSEARAMSIVLDSLPATLELIFCSVPFILGLGVWLGTKAALNRNGRIDHLARVVGTFGASFPIFILGEILILMCVAQFKFYPGGGLDYQVSFDLNLRIATGLFARYTGMNTIDALLNGDLLVFIDAVKHLVFPVALLVFSQTAVLMKVTRSGLIEQYGKPYVSAAMAKGLSRNDVMYKHARRNGMISVLTISGLLLGNMFVGLVITETVFNIHGFGYLTAYSAQILDTPVLFASTTIVALAYIIINLAVDILYICFDPRIRL